MNQEYFALDGGLFQSELWKEFQVSLGKEIFSTPLFWGVIQEAPVLGKYAEVSRGPSQDSIPPAQLNDAISELVSKHKISLLRVEPQHDAVLKNLFQTDLSVRKAPLDAQPKEILMLNLDKSEEEILAAMKPKTRYNIRLAQKKGVEVRPLKNKEEEEQFLAVLAATASRKNISFHKKEYYQKFIEFFSEEKGTTFVAIKNGKVLAGGTVIIFGDTAYYMHGGSSDEGRESMAPHLLQWEQIRFAKAKGCTRYDFGGVAIQHTEKGKDWTGITRFKVGFAPATESTLFPGTYDIIFSPARYWSYYLLTKIKKLLV